LLDPLPRGARLLDVGAASGYLAQVLRQRGFHRIDGIECDPALAAQGRAWYDELVVGDVAGGEWPWPDAAFDAIVCADVLEHLRDPGAVLARVARLTRPGGTVIVSLPSPLLTVVTVALLVAAILNELPAEASDTLSAATPV